MPLEEGFCKEREGEGKFFMKIYFNLRIFLKENE